MSSLDAHISKAVHNINTMAFLATDTTTYPSRKDWIAAVAFYTGLHVVDAVLYHQNTGTGQQHGCSHARRTQFVKSNNRLAKIWRCYRPLYNTSRIARYMQDELTPAGEHVLFDRYMPDEKFIPFLRARLGGLIKSAGKFIPQAKAAELQAAFDTDLGDYLDLGDAAGPTQPETPAPPAAE